MNEDLNAEKKRSRVYAENSAKPPYLLLSYPSISAVKEKGSQP